MRGTCLGVLPSAWTNRVAEREKARLVNIRNTGMGVRRSKMKNSTFTKDLSPCRARSCDEPSAHTR